MSCGLDVQLPELAAPDFPDVSLPTPPAIPAPPSLPFVDGIDIEFPLPPIPELAAPGFPDLGAPALPAMPGPPSLDGFHIPEAPTLVGAVPIPPIPSLPLPPELSLPDCPFDLAA